ncbi:MAG: hypothetical protein ACREJ2_18240 [Planctomycetota bacterium]
MSDQPRADAVRYRDPRAERCVRRFLRPAIRPPRVQLPDGSFAPQSGVRAYAPLLGSDEQTIYIDCVNEAATDTWTAAEVNRRVNWQPSETVELDGRSFEFQRGYFTGDAFAPPASKAGERAASAAPAGRV